MYGVEAKVLNQTVKGNIERFAEDFMFQLDADETDTEPRATSDPTSRKA